MHRLVLGCARVKIYICKPCQLRIASNNVRIARPENAISNRPQRRQLSYSPTSHDSADATVARASSAADQIDHAALQGDIEEGKKREGVAANGGKDADAPIDPKEQQRLQYLDLVRTWAELSAEFNKLKADVLHDPEVLKPKKKDIQQRADALERQYTSVLEQSSLEWKEGHREYLSNSLLGIQKVRTKLANIPVKSDKTAGAKAVKGDAGRSLPQAKNEPRTVNNATAPLPEIRKRALLRLGVDPSLLKAPVLSMLDRVAATIVSDYSYGDWSDPETKAKDIRDIRSRAAGHFNNAKMVDSITILATNEIQRGTVFMLGERTRLRKSAAYGKDEVALVSTAKVGKEKGRIREFPADGKNPERDSITTATSGTGQVREIANDGKDSRGLSIKEALLRRQEVIAPSTFENEPWTKTQLIGSKTKFQSVDVPQPTVRGLSYGLDRVLFNPGVYRLQDDRSGVYNFDPYLEQLIPVQDFNFDLLPAFTTSSQDKTLLQIAQKHQKKYTGSSSSMTGVLSQFHFLLSKFRPLNHQTISRSIRPKDFQNEFTPIAKVPASIFLRWKPDTGVYAIDADKEHDSNNVLSLLGNSLEKLLTLDKSEYLKYRRDSTETISDEERQAPESYHYTGSGDILMRSQLDAHDPRLPGTGMFDLKTRAIWPIRMDVENYQIGKDYEIKTQYGKFESYEREYMDMIRATTIKYMLQVRIGRMDGIFVAYHNTQRIFGFQYIPLEELDLSIHGQYDRSLGDQEFALSVSMLNDVLNRATEKFPNTTLRLLFRTVGAMSRTRMLVFAEPVTEQQVDDIQTRNAREVAAVTAELKSGKAPNYDDTGKRIIDYSMLPQEDGSDAAEASVAEPEDLEAAREDISREDIREEDAPATSLEADTSWPDANEDLSELMTAGEEAAALAESGAKLFAVEIKTKNFVNDREVVRPGFDAELIGDDIMVKRQDDKSERFSAARGDSWNVSYSVDELEPERAWGLYLAARKARDTILEQSSEEKAASLKTIRDLGKVWSEKGKEWRDAKNEEARGKEKVIYGE